MFSDVHAAHSFREIREMLRAGRGEDSLRHWIWGLTLFPPVLLILTVALQPWFPAGDLLRDPLAVAEMSSQCCKVHFGAVSNLGVLIWASCAAVCLFAGLFLAVVHRATESAVFLVSAGMLTGVLTLDDLYLVHDHILPALGVSQPVTYGAYGLLGLAYLMLSWRQILSHRYWLLTVAIMLLGLSVTIDWFFHSDHPARIILEDGAKLVGICAWTAFHATAAWDTLSPPVGAISR